MSFKRDGGEDTHTFLIPCLGWITRLQKVRFFSLPVFGIRGNLGTYHRWSHCVWARRPSPQGRTVTTANGIFTGVKE